MFVLASAPSGGSNRLYMCAYALRLSRRAFLPPRRTCPVSRQRLYFILCFELICFRRKLVSCKSSKSNVSRIGLTWMFSWCLIRWRTERAYVSSSFSKVFLSSNKASLAYARSSLALSKALPSLSRVSLYWNWRSMKGSRACFSDLTRANLS